MGNEEYMENAFNQMCSKYYAKFGMHYPTFNRGLTFVEAIEEMQQCIETNKPYVENIPDDALI